MDRLTPDLFRGYVTILDDEVTEVIIEGDLLIMTDLSGTFAAWNLIDGSYTDDW